MKETELTALVSDDEPLILGLVSRILEQKGFKLEVVDTNEGALKLLDDGRDYDLVLTDLNQTPNGVHVYEKALMHGIMAYIITGGTNRDSILQDLERVPPQHIIRKPFSVLDLVKLLDGVKYALENSLPQPLYNPGDKPG